MSHNPNTVKSQDDLSTTNDGKRSSEVLLTTLEELEKTKKQLDKAKKSIQSALQYLACMDRISEEKCNEQLAFDELRKTLEELNKWPISARITTGALVSDYHRISFVAVNIPSMSSELTFGSGV